MKIVVASSNVFRRELSSYILSEAGYTVYEANDSTMLLHCLNEFQPRLILLDHRLVGMETPELVEHFDQHRGVPIMVLTNGNGKPAPPPAPTSAIQGNDYLAWPYDTNDLLSHVHALIHNHHTPMRYAS